MMKSFKTIAMTAIATTAISLSACAQDRQKTTENNANGKTLVAYFSATGTTKRAAEKIAKENGGDLYQITPAQPYTSADLDWNDRQSRTTAEMNDASTRPALAGNDIDVAPYDTIYLGYPIWWGKAPRIINTFIEKHNLEGKVIMPFATSGGSGIGQSVSELKKTYPKLNWQNGQLKR